MNNVDINLYIQIYYKIVDKMIIYLSLKNKHTYSLTHFNKKYDLISDIYDDIENVLKLYNFSSRNKTSKSLEKSDITIIYKYFDLVEKDCIYLI